VVDDQEGIREQLSKYICRSGEKDKTLSLVQQAKARLLGVKPADMAGVGDDDDNYLVDTASQGEEAYELVKLAVAGGKPYRVIFLDMRMPPGWDGLETMEKVWEADPKVQVVLCSAYSDYSWKNIVERVGKRDNLLILKKPFDVAEVSQLALALTEKHIMASEMEQGTLELKRINQELQQQIIERECIGDALRYTRNYLNSVFQSLPSMLISVDQRGIVTQWNTATEKFSGIPSDQALSLELWELLPFLDEYRGNFDTVLRNGQPQELRRKNVGGADGAFMDISMYPITYKDEHADGGVQGVVLRIDDVTELERKSDHLRQAQKMDTVGKLAAGLAHDFKNVIGGIMGTLSSMKFSLDNNLQPGLEELKTSLSDDIEIIEESAKNGQDLIKRLLNLSSKKQELAFADVDLNEVVRSVMKLCQNTVPKSVEITTTYLPGQALVRAYPSQLEQVLLNLCVNAGHAMTIMRGEGEREGGSLTVAVDRRSVDKRFCDSIPGALEGSYLRLAVSDTGVGIGPETLSKIFDPFFTTKPKSQGSGLGLSMVYNIIKQHNGFVDVKSSPGNGATFYVYLPELAEGGQDAVKAAK